MNLSPSLVRTVVALLSLATVALMKGQSLSWSEIPIQPSPRRNIAMAYDSAAAYLLLFGGGNGGELPTIAFGDTWIFRRNAWTQLIPAVSPAPRQGAAMAYDPTTETVVLFGGFGTESQPLADTWTWDGATWTQEFPPVSPTPRGFDVQAMAYDPINGAVLMFGGGGNGGPLADTWEWNGKAKTWTQLFPATSPDPRGGGPLAYDGANKTIVLFGGSNGCGDSCNVYYNDTWVWNGVTWTEQFPSVSPSPRNVSQMAYDPAIGRIVLFGGYSTPGVGLPGTWTWNGSTWKEISMATQPEARWGEALFFDPAADALILFGGQLTGDPLDNTTWVLK